jgi:carbon-monoxide dehydrogenase medium subunit
MKAPNIRYIKPRSLADAYAILEHHGGAALPLAGGQSLLAGLNMRLSSPQLLVDIGGLPELNGCDHDAGEVRLGALTRHCELLRSPLIRERLPLLTKAAAHVGHWAIRNRGTLGGSLAYADPAAELPACSVALAATVVLGSRAGEREVKAEDFFKGLFETDLRPGELILRVRFPAPEVQPVTAFAELSRRRGDFALVGVAAVATLAGPRIAGARIVYFGCADRAKVARAVSTAVAGLHLPLSGDEPFAPLLAHDLKPDDTPGCRADTKLHLAKVLTRRALNALVTPEAAADVRS